jgi:hypothetical protein
VEISLENAQTKGIEVLEEEDHDLGHWHLVNALEFIKNAQSLADLEK